MGDLQFNIYFCWMSEETFSEQIMIYKPISTITRCFTEAALQQFEIATVGELIDYLKDDIAIKESLGTWGLAHLSTATVYIQHHGYLLGMREEKTISEIFRDLETSRLEFAYFIVAAHLFTMRPAIDLPFIPTKKFMNICRMFMFQKQEWRYVILWSLCCQWILL